MQKKINIYFFIPSKINKQLGQRKWTKNRRYIPFNERIYFTNIIKNTKINFYNWYITNGINANSRGVFWARDYVAIYKVKEI